MATANNGMHINKCLLVWGMPIPDTIKILFTIVFVNLSELIKYVSKDIRKTDTFHLIIPLACLQDLLIDPVYKFPQVRRIDVYYDGINDLKKIRHRFKSEYEKIQFCTVYDFLRQLEKVELDKALFSSDAIDRSAIDSLVSLIKDRLHAKQLALFIHISPVLKQCVSTSSHGLLAKNINDFPSWCICPSCKLIYQQIYQLECGHRQCEICAYIQKKCATCFEAVSRDKISLDRDLQMKMQDLSTCCSNCEWTGPWKDYQVHLEQTHCELITCLIRSREIDESSFYQEYLTGTNQDIFLGNHSSLDSDVSITSLNGTCIWGISGISDMRNNAESDEQKSIYSSPFYIFPHGYKMCLRLFINGDRTARGTHMSLFFVLMQGNYDAYLQWPFKFKVTFTLFNYLSSDNNQSDFFWPDTTSVCCERPRSDMNIAYGIPKFLSLDQFKKNENQYVQDDIMLIKVEIDISAEKPTLPSIDNAGELLNEDEHTDTTYDNLPFLVRDSSTL